MPTPQLNLPQQFGRFLLTGALVFILLSWGLSSLLISSGDVHRDFLALRMLLRACAVQPFPTWLRDFQSAYVPFFLHQQRLLACYLIAVPLAWLAAFLCDTKILRKENML